MQDAHQWEDARCSEGFGWQALVAQSPQAVWEIMQELEAPALHSHFLDCRAVDFHVANCKGKGVARDAYRTQLPRRNLAQALTGRDKTLAKTSRPLQAPALLTMHLSDTGLRNIQRGFEHFCVEV